MIYAIPVIERSQSQTSKRSLHAIAQGLEKAFEFAGKDVPTCKYHLINRIPFARGYGEQCPLALERMPVSIGMAVSPEI
jgi:hypothetical protein